MEWTALWFAALTEKLAPGVWSDGLRRLMRSWFDWVIDRPAAEQGGAIRARWVLAVLLPGVLLQWLVSWFDGAVGWLLQAVVFYFALGWGRLTVFSDELAPSEWAAESQGRSSEPSMRERAQAVLHDVLAPLLVLMVGQVLGVPVLLIVAYVCVRERCHGLVIQPAEADEDAQQWATRVWSFIDALMTRMGLLLLAMVGRFDAVFEVWLDQAPRWNERHETLWEHGLNAAIGSTPTDEPFVQADMLERLAARAVWAAIGMNTLLAWL